MRAKFTIQKIADDAVSDASRLAGLPLESFLIESTPGTFVFQLRHLRDATELQLGSIVLLD